MLLLIVFAFVAGVVTILSPCILPILPIILSSSFGAGETSRSRPFGIILGFIISFTFFTLFLSTIVRLTGVSPDLLRTFSVVVIAGFGISLLIPSFQVFLEKMFTGLSRFVPQGNKNPSFFGGIFVGVSLGLLWTPCVGPIIASVIALALTGTVTADTFIVTLSYSIGTAIPMLAIMLGGQTLLKKIPWLLANTEKIQKIFGVVMIVTALAIFAGLDRRFQTFILEKFPSYGSGLTQFEDVDIVKDRLKEVVGTEPVVDDMGKPSFELTEKGSPAPEIIAGGEWFNSKPLRLSDLRGKVVLIDFWTYSCINCLRTLPYLQSWWAKYKDDGFVIIGVHSPEFEFEKNPENVTKALNDLSISYPVVQDNNFATWRAYQNRYWPAKYLINKDGSVVYSHFGEGSYDETELQIQALLKEAGMKVEATRPNNATYANKSQTPEIYLGYGKLAGLAFGQQVQKDKSFFYQKPKNILSNEVGFEGNWLIKSEYALASKGAKLYLNFTASKVFLVMRPTDKPVKIKGTLTEGGLSGEITIDGDKLYKLADFLDQAKSSTMVIEFEEGGVEVYAFTFG